MNVANGNSKKALIVGISGQDGAYLAQLLLSKGYEVIGTARDAQTAFFQNLVHLGIRDKVQTESMALNDFRSVLQTLVKVNPNELYNLAGQTVQHFRSMGRSDEEISKTFRCRRGRGSCHRVRRQGAATSSS